MKNKYVQLPKLLPNQLSNHPAGEDVVTFLHLGILNQ